MHRTPPGRLSRRIAAAGVGLLMAACGESPSAPASSESGLPLAEATSPIAFVQVTNGGAHTCGVTSEGRAYCWGRNTLGQLGNGTLTGALRPTPVAGNLVFRSLSAGFAHTCGVTTDFVAYCWGDGIAGRLGDGTAADRLTPTKVAGGLHVGSVVSGLTHTCGLTEPERNLYCWGENSSGELGDGSTTERDAPVPIAAGRAFRQVSAGSAHTCAVTPAFVAYCWGWDFYGQLGDNATRQDRHRPQLVAGGRSFTQISAGNTRTCAVTTDNHAFCWGMNPVGDGSELQRFTPRAVRGNLSFRRVTVGGNHTCGESTAGKAYCWGIGQAGSLGTGAGGTFHATTPLAVSGGLNFAQLSAGGSTCGTTKTGPTYCWGENSDGQLGDGTAQSRFVPTQVAQPE